MPDHHTKELDFGYCTDGGFEGEERIQPHTYHVVSYWGYIVQFGMILDYFRDKCCFLHVSDRLVLLFRDVDWTKGGSWRTGEGDDLHSNHTFDSIWRVWSSQALIRSDLTTRNIYYIHICIYWFCCVYFLIFSRHLQCCTVTLHTYIDLDVNNMTYVCAIAGWAHSSRFHAMF